jgi:hypothetical protein
MANVIFNNCGTRRPKRYIMLLLITFPQSRALLYCCIIGSKVKLIYRVTVELIVRMLRRKTIEKKAKLFPLTFLFVFNYDCAVTIYGL